MTSPNTALASPNTTLVVNIGPDAIAQLSAGTYRLKLGQSKLDDIYDDSLAGNISIFDNSETPASADGLITATLSGPLTVRFNLPSSTIAWYWVGYKIPNDTLARAIRPIGLGQIYEAIVATGNGTVSGDGASPPTWLSGRIGFKNDKTVIPLIYRETPTAGTQPSSPTSMQPWKTLKALVPGVARFRFRASGTVYVWFESPAVEDSTDADDIEAVDQSKSKALVYREVDKATKTIYYYNDDTWNDTPPPEAPGGPPAA